MDVIRSLEPTPRGVYCGAIGLVGPPGAPVRARFSVAIRTAVVDTATGDAVYGTGGGITWDSEPAAEHAEVVTKAAVLSAHVHEFELLETLRYEPHRGLRNRDRHLRRMAESAEHLGFRFDPSDAVEALRARTHGRRRGTGPVAAAAHRSGGRRRGAVPRRAAGPRRPRARRRTGRPGRAVALPQDDVPGALRASAAAAARRRRRHHGQHAPGAHRGHARHPRAGPRRDLVHAPAVVRVSARASSGPACSTAVSCTSGCSGARTWRRPGGWR